MSEHLPFDTATSYVLPGVTGKYFRFDAVPYRSRRLGVDYTVAATLFDYLEIAIFSDTALANFASIFPFGRRIKFHSHATGYCQVEPGFGNYEVSAGDGSLGPPDAWLNSTYHAGSGTAAVPSPTGSFPSLPSSGSQGFVITNNAGTTTSAGTVTITDASSQRFWRQDYANLSPGPWQVTGQNFSSGTLRSAALQQLGGIADLVWYDDACSPVSWAYGTLPKAVQAGMVVTQSFGATVAEAFLYLRAHLRSMIWDTSPSPDTVNTNSASSASLLPFSDGDVVRLRHA